MKPCRLSELIALQLGAYIRSRSMPLERCHAADVAKAQAVTRYTEETYIYGTSKRTRGGEAQRRLGRGTVPDYVRCFHWLPCDRHGDPSVAASCASGSGAEYFSGRTGSRQPVCGSHPFAGVGWPTFRYARPEERGDRRAINRGRSRRPLPDLPALRRDFCCHPAHGPSAAWGWRKLHHLSEYPHGSATGIQIVH